MVPALDNILSDLIDAVISGFTDVWGDLFWGILFSVIIGAMYYKSDSPGPPAAAMMIIGTLMTAVVSSEVRYFFAIMAGVGLAAIIYVTFKGRE